MSKIKKKFAWLPRVVWTWRPSPSKALIWMQVYYHKIGKEYIHPFGVVCVNEKYCLKIGPLSREL